MLGKKNFCDQYGHKAAQCRSNPESKELPGAGGAVKKAGAGNWSGVKGGPPKLTKAAKRRQNKLKKKPEEEAAKLTEAEAVSSRPGKIVSQ